MKKIRFQSIALAWLACLFLAPAAISQPAEEESFDELQGRLYSRYFTPVNPALITPLRNALQANGTFSDINYNANRLDAFQEHLERVAMFARAHAAGRLQNDPDLFADLVSSLDYWLTTDYRDPNWWWTYIGFPGRLIPITALTAEHLREPHRDVYDKLIAYHTRVYNYSQSNPHGFGANLSDMGYRALVGAIMDRDAAQMDRVINNTFLVALPMLGRANNRDGWRPDGTMFGHGPQLHNATYGREMALSASRAISLLWGTEWDLGRELLDLLEWQLLEGVKRMTYGSWFDFNAAGRAVSRPAGQALANGYTGIIETVLELDPRYPERLELLLQRIRNGPHPTQEVSGTKSFYYSDFMTHIRRDYYTSVRMISNRTNRNEMLNNEGIQHLYFGDGIQFSLVHGDEYATLAPIWHYARLPGLTARQVSNLRPQSFMGERGANPFANSVTGGLTGLAAMRLQHMSMTGWKSWFLIDEGVVALGTGISVGNQQHTEPVFTTLNQTRYSGGIWLSGEDEPVFAELPFETESTDLDWVWHRDIGYVLMGENDPLRVTAETVTGSWADVGTSSGSVTGDVFTLYFDHGSRPVGKSYSYMVLPASTPEQTMAHAQNPPVEIIRQDGWVHAVRHKRTGAIYAAFLGEQILNLGDGKSIYASDPVLLMLTPLLGQWTLVASDPRFSLTSATIELTGFEMEGEGLTPVGTTGDRYELEIVFPQGDYRGSRVMHHFIMPGHPLYDLGTTETLEDGWIRSGGFGPLKAYEDGWAYYAGRGWVYLRSDSSENIFMYDAASGHWLWTSASLPGYAYDLVAREWVTTGNP